MRSSRGGLIERKALSLAVVGYWLVLPPLVWTWSGKVVGVIDGDSITVLHDRQQEEPIRLWGIHCSETSDN